MKNNTRILKLKKAFEKVLDIMGLNIKDNSLINTPNRIAKMFVNETCRGLYSEEPNITVFDNDWKYTGMVLVKKITVKSLCEYHFQPFIWVCHIAYIPKEKIIGLSKFSRVVDYFARRPQVQEKLTTQIFDFLAKKLWTEDIAVYINAEHLCMKIRWVNEHSSNTITSKLGWVFMSDSKVRAEFYNGSVKRNGL